MPARILSVSYDPILLHTRELILRKAGYSVVSVVGFTTAIKACDDHVDVVVMGHSIPKEDKRAIVAALREKGCHAPVLSLIRHGDEPIPEAAKAVEPDPQHVLDGIASLLETAKPLLP
jgi:DNA-binding response OmpR family regulator